ncbi:hypothetical protein Clacol_005698 [Clathrus columnatus]|uniref:Mug135-like C-terminal domain-containing protein n=1 Tax=Clathrus columnatus TaxID=1419009 RepID=A0AAV5AEY7_9AGAM|nr:hypothetical protein Clacol_005698 [Clathrus columnatus]
MLRSPVPTKPARDATRLDVVTRSSSTINDQLQHYLCRSLIHNLPFDIQISAMDPVPVIPPPAGGSALPFIVPPPPSQIPPTDANISNAHDYVMDVTRFRRTNPDLIADVDYADAVRYESTVLANTEAAEPAWFQPALQIALGPITNLLNTIQGRLDVFQIRQTELIRTISKSINSDAGTGDNAPLQIVPFPDGTHPSDFVPLLPLLDTVGSVRGLTAQQRGQYLHRYYPNVNFVGVTLEQRVRRLFEALGCRARA